MAKRFLYIIDPLSTLNPKTDTTLAIIDEADRRGIKNYVCKLKDIVLKDGRLWFFAAPVKINRDHDMAPRCEEEPLMISASQFSVIFMRKDPPVDDAFIASLLMLRCYEPDKSVVLNEPDGILVANEKLFGCKIAPQFYPPTVVSQSLSVIMDFAREHGQIVLKPLFRAGGSGILVFDSNDRNLRSAIEILTSNCSSPLMAQSYVKSARDGDKRIILLGGNALGAIMRVPRNDDHRANFHAGGLAKKAHLNDRDHAIVAALREPLRKLGLHFVGIDVIGGFLTEINVTSPTCVIEIETLSQVPKETRLRTQIMDYVEGLIA